VLGVDIAPQPYYPFPFERGDALTFPLDGFDVVHGSMPCQLFSRLTRPKDRAKHLDLLTPLRARLRDWGGPYVLENVEGAPLDGPVWLCGSAFGLGVLRHRGFESSVPLAGTGCAHALVPEPLRVYGSGLPQGVKAARAAMGIDWLPFDALAESIPPAFTAYLGRQLRAALGTTLPTGTSDASPPAAGRIPLEPATFVDRRGDETDGAGGCDEAPTSVPRICPCGCRRGLPLPKATGRWPLYFEPACKHRAFRQRRKAAAELPAPPEHERLGVTWQERRIFETL
jgi:hypothetical protein